jgi:hypothetical protein
MKEKKMIEKKYLVLIALLAIILIGSPTLIADYRITGHVDGFIRIYNPQFGTWAASDGEPVQVKIWNDSGYEQYYSFPVTQNGYYDASFVGAQGAASCNQARVIFRGQAYYSAFVYSTGITIDIDFYPDR